MKKKFLNTEIVEGRVYQHALVKKTVQNTESKNFGKEYINGTVSVATDEDGLNVVDVHYSYVTPTTNSGNTNKTFNILSQIMEGATWIENGKDAALKVKLTPSLDVNDFYNNEKQLVTTKRNEGGFAEIVNALSPEEKNRATFKIDMVMTGIKRVEADPENGVEQDYVEIRGVAFDFRNAILPIDVRVKNEGGMTYFEGLDISPSSPVFTTVWGKIVSTTKVERVEEPTAFGETSVRETRKTVKEYCITGANPDSPEFGDENTITESELKKAIQDREVHLAEVRKNQEEYQASKAATENKSVAVGATSVQSGDFVF